jgi:glycosyltransferase involved in cell wall biosynthesis
MTSSAGSERKRALLIAFHYPPVATSSGLQRTLAFSKYLPEYGWEPLVLTVSPRAYDVVRNDQLADIPEDIVVKRAFGLDARRHLAVAGRYPSWLATPDRWSSWFIGGTLTGLGLLRRYRPHVIWSTFPIATAHLIGLALRRLSGLPWVADFRDPMTEPGYVTRPGHGWIERETARQASRVVFTTPSTLRMYAERYPDQPAERWLELPNGYDEDTFHSVETGVRTSAPRTGPITLVHSGVLYPNERDPSAFFAAIARLKSSGVVDSKKLRVVLRAAGHDALYGKLIENAGVMDIVELAAAAPYRDALREMLEADGLLIFQAANCNINIPAKVYECLRARRPIFALTDASGDTARVLRASGIDTIVPIDDDAAIAAGLARFLDDVRSGSAPTPLEHAVLAHSRRALTAELAACFDAVTAATAVGAQRP